MKENTFSRKLWYSKFYFYVSNKYIVELPSLEIVHNIVFIYQLFQLFPINSQVMIFDFLPRQYLNFKFSQFF